MHGTCGHDLTNAICAGVQTAEAETAADVRGGAGVDGTVRPGVELDGDAWRCRLARIEDPVAVDIVDYLARNRRRAQRCAQRRRRGASDKNQKKMSTQTVIVSVCRLR